jgi:hypothetical protein
MGELVIIVATSPLLSQHKDQSTAEAPADWRSHKGARKVVWDSFEIAPGDSSTSTCLAQFRSSTHDAAGAYNNYYPTYQPVISAPDHCTARTINAVQARSFPSVISTMVADNLSDRQNDGQSDFIQGKPCLLPIS